MATIHEILTRKGAHVWSVGKDVSVLQASRMMHEHNIGALVVTEGNAVAGMFTERDVVRRVVGERRDPEQTPVGDVMTTEVYCARPLTSVDEARKLMMNGRLRHLPVVDDQGRLLGLISMTDLNAYQVASQEQTIYMLNEYLYGRV